MTGYDVAVDVMFVIMVMVIDAQLGCHRFTKQGNEFRMPGNRLGMTGATDMLVQANDMISRRHHHMQVVRHHQHPAASMIPDPPDQGVQFGLAAQINALNRLVQNQQIRIAEQGASQQNPLHLTAGYILDRAVGNMINTCLFKHTLTQSMPHIAAGKPQGQESFDADWQCRINIQALRHVSDPQIRTADNIALICGKQAQHDPGHGRFSCSVGANQGDDFANPDPGFTVFKNLSSGKRHINAAGFY